MVYLLKTKGEDESPGVGKQCLTAMYELVRAKPDVGALAGSASRKEDGPTKTKNKWWKKFNPFSS